MIASSIFLIRQNHSNDWWNFAFCTSKVNTLQRYDDAYTPRQQIMIIIDAGNGLHEYKEAYHKTSNIRRTLVGNEIVDHSDVVVGAAPTTS